MTKMKSKKMTKSTFAIIIMGIVMVAMLAFGGTFAYFTATANKKEATLTTGTVKLVDNGATIIDKSMVLPGDTLLGAVTYDPAETTVKSIVIVHYELAAGDSGLTVVTPNSVWKKVAENGTKANYYYQVVNVDEHNTVTGFTNTFTDAITIATTPDVDWAQSATQKPAAMGATIRLTLEARSIQYRNIGSGINEDSEAATVANTACELLFPASKA